MHVQGTAPPHVRALCRRSCWHWSCPSNQEPSGGGSQPTELPCAATPAHSLGQLPQEGVWAACECAFQGSQEHQPEVTEEQEQASLPSPTSGHCQHQTAGLSNASPRHKAVQQGACINLPQREGSRAGLPAPACRNSEGLSPKRCFPTTCPQSLIIKQSLIAKGCRSLMYHQPALVFPTSSVKVVYGRNLLLQLPTTTTTHPSIPPGSTRFVQKCFPRATLYLHPPAPSSSL